MAEDLQHSVVLICGGPAPDEKAIEYIPTPSTLIAVDSGLDHARSLQLKPDLKNSAKIYFKEIFCLQL